MRQEAQGEVQGEEQQVVQGLQPDHGHKWHVGGTQALADGDKLDVQAVHAHAGVGPPRSPAPPPPSPASPRSPAPGSTKAAPR